MIEGLQLATIMLGVCATLFPLFTALYFMRDIHGIGLRIAIMLLGETVSMASATYFAINSYFHLYNALPPDRVMYLRWLIFITAAASTAYLVVYLKYLARRPAQRDRRAGDKPL